MKKQTPDEIEKIQQQILAREVEEELQKERLKKFWEKYRLLIMGVLIGIVLIVAGNEIYRTWYLKVRLSESDQFETALIDAHAGKTSEALKIFTDLSQNARTGYQYLAQMQIAGIQLEEGNLDQALQTLSDLMNASEAPQQLRAVATLAYVGHQVDTGDPKQLQSLLDPYMDPQNSFAPAAIELGVVLQLRQGETQKAIGIIKTALSMQGVDPEVKKQLEELLSVIEK